MFSIIHRSTDFCNEFCVHILCEFSIVLDYDEMNCILIFRVLYNVLWSVDSGNNYASNVGMNCNVKFIET